LNGGAAYFAACLTFHIVTKVAGVGVDDYQRKKDSGGLPAAPES